MPTSKTVSPTSILAPVHVRPTTAGQDDSLDASIRANGVMNAPLVRLLSDGSLRCTDGWRRICSAIRLNLPEILVTAEEMDDLTERVRLFRANRDRVNSSRFDEAAQLLAIMREGQLTQAAAARMLDLSPGWASKLLACLKGLTPLLYEAAVDGRLPTTTGYYAAQLPADVQQTLVGREEEVSLAEVKRLIGEHCPRAVKAPPTKVEHNDAALTLPGGWGLQETVDVLQALLAAARKAQKHPNTSPGDILKFI